MGRMRIVSIVLIGIGVLLTAIAGYWIATESGRSGLSVGDVLLQAAIFFAFIFPLIVGGIYLYARSSADDDGPVNTDMVLQRRILDALPLLDATSFASLATQLGVSEAEIAEQMALMADLAIFNGCIDWTSANVTKMTVADLHALTQCVRCQAPIRIQPTGQTICPNCACQYCVV